MFSKRERLFRGNNSCQTTKHSCPEISAFFMFKITTNNQYKSRLTITRY